jgi:hypothetical protein
VDANKFYRKTRSSSPNKLLRLTSRLHRAQIFALPETRVGGGALESIDLSTAKPDELKFIAATYVVEARKRKSLRPCQKGLRSFLRVLKRKILHPNKFHFPQNPRSSRQSEGSGKTFHSSAAGPFFRLSQLSESKVYHSLRRLSFDLSIDFSSLIRSKIKKAICKFSGSPSLLPPKKLFLSARRLLLPRRKGNFCLLPAS